MRDISDELAELFDLDFGHFADDLPFYENLARRCEGPILELGVGAGRVAIPLARAGFEVWGIDSSEAVLARARAKRAGKGAPVPIQGLIPGMALHFAGCCHALPRDRIVGIVTTGRGVTIHTIDCETLESFSDMSERWLDVAWDVELAENQVGRIHVTVINQPGALSSLSTVIAKNLGNILNLKITHRSADFFEMAIDVEVENLKHLSNIIAALRATPAINSVERARG